MYSLWIFGEAIEEVFGSKKFLRLYLLSILGGGAELLQVSVQCVNEAVVVV